MNDELTKPNEQWLINKIRKRFGTLTLYRKFQKYEISVPMSELDDCCVIGFKDNPNIVIGSDYIRGNGFKLFKLGLLNFFDIGYYLVVANLSDLAAMGASPVGITLIIRYPDGSTRSQLNQLIDGIATACEKFGHCNLLGGDSGGASDFVLSATALGITENPFKRSNAMVGDKVYILGHPGIAGAAYSLCEAGFIDQRNQDIDHVNQLLNAWRRPYAFIHEALSISKLRKRIACQDTSDGLKTALNQVAESSKVLISIDESQLKPHEILKWSAKKLGVDFLELYFGASVDFGLLLTAPPEVDILKTLAVFPDTTINCIGQVKMGEPGTVLCQKDGKITSIPGAEYNQ